MITGFSQDDLWQEKSRGEHRYRAVLRVEVRTQIDGENKSGGKNRYYYIFSNGKHYFSIL